MLSEFAETPFQQVPRSSYWKYPLFERFCNPDNLLLIRRLLDLIELYKTPYRKPGIEILLV
jgi:hypothetical protein